MNPHFEIKKKNKRIIIIKEKNKRIIIII